jgi:hypothetical protein
MRRTWLRPSSAPPRYAATASAIVGPAIGTPHRSKSCRVEATAMARQACSAWSPLQQLGCLLRLERSRSALSGWLRAPQGQGPRGAGVRPGQGSVGAVPARGSRHRWRNRTPQSASAVAVSTKWRNERPSFHIPRVSPGRSWSRTRSSSGRAASAPAAPLAVSVNPR